MRYKFINSNTQLSQNTRADYLHKKLDDFVELILSKLLPKKGAILSEVITKL